MAELGSIFEEQGDGPRGRDLRVTVRVPRSAPHGEVRVRVPLEVAAEGGYVRRADPHGDGETLTLRLPDPIPPGAVLRLRGLGALAPAAGGAPGDLYVELEPVDGAGDLVPAPAAAAAARLPWVGVGGLVVLLVIALRACGG